jgi:transcriptional regulator with XRE-family HTH domain
MLRLEVNRHRCSVRAFGRLVRLYRKSRGWTQETLAMRSGYSDRVIRKMELNGFVAPRTVVDVAETLSTDTRKIDPKSLWLTCENQVRLFCEVMQGVWTDHQEIAKSLFAFQPSVKISGTPWSNLVRELSDPVNVAEWAVELASSFERSGMGNLRIHRCIKDKQFKVVGFPVCKHQALGGRLRCVEVQMEFDELEMSKLEVRFETDSNRDIVS